MIEIQIDYRGELHCDAVHGPSTAIVSTDAPVDNQGKGESFSPTDLLATALGSCMATVMGITASRKEIDLRGMRIRVEKYMSDEQPRRVSKLAVKIHMPIEEDHPERKLLQATVHGCPVNHSIHADIEVPVSWVWANGG